MGLTFDTLISHNKRTSTLLIITLVVLTGIMCSLIGRSMGGPQWMFLGAIFGGALSVGGAIYSYYFGDDLITQISHARQILHSDDPELFNVVEEMAISAGLPMPRVYLITDSSPNAFATGRDPEHALIAVTTGLREKLSRDELQGVVAHEMSHIKNYDIRLMMLVGVFAGMLVLLSDSYRYTINTRATRFSDDRSDRESPNGMIFGIIGLILSIFAPIIAQILQLALSREREYLADATAVQLSRNPLALAGALKKIAMDPDELSVRNRAVEHLYIMSPSPAMRLSGSNLDSIFATHPPTIKRIQRLEAMAQGSK